jgi:hypothetical protein
MALTDEQRALLQLLLEGGQGYDDIGSLLGIAPEEVRTRARGALREIGGADPDSQVQLSEYLLGQADPIGRADAVRHLQADPEANALATRLVAQLRLIAPRAELPEIPAAKAGRAAKAQDGPAAPAQASPGASGRAPGSPADKRRTQLGVGLGALALLIVVGALALAGIFDGGDDGSGEGDATTATTASGASTENQAVVRMAPLDEASGATGQAVFAPTQDQPVMELNLSGLEPSAEGQIYVVWLYANDKVAFPIARDRVDESGNLTGGTPLGAEVLALLTQFGCLDVSLASTAETERAIQQAVDGGALPPHTGETVLRGQIPAAPGETAPTGADSDCDIAQPQGNGQGQAQGAGQGQGGGQ